MNGIIRGIDSLDNGNGVMFFFYREIEMEILIGEILKNIGYLFFCVHFFYAGDTMILVFYGICYFLGG